MTPVYKTERRAASQSQRHRHVPFDPEETVIFRGTRNRANWDAPSQIMTDTDHYLEIIDSSSSSSSHEAEETSSGREQVAASVVIENENPVLPYEDLDATTLVNRGPPEPSVYDNLTH